MRAEVRKSHRALTLVFLLLASTQLILLSFNNGESKADEIDSMALLVPEDLADPIIAFPLLDKTVLASFKSIF